MYPSLTYHGLFKNWEPPRLRWKLLKEEMWWRSARFGVTQFSPTSNCRTIKKITSLRPCLKIGMLFQSMTMLINQPGSPSCKKWVEEQAPTARLTLRTDFEGEKSSHHHVRQGLCWWEVPCRKHRERYGKPWKIHREVQRTWSGNAGFFFHICVDLLDVVGENGFMLSIQQINGVFLLP